MQEMRLLTIIFVLTILTACSSKQTEKDTYQQTIEKNTEPDDCFANTDTTFAKDCRGCAGGFVYKSLGNNKYLVVQIDREQVELTSTCITYDLQKDKNKIRVWVEYFDTDSTYATNYCTDVVMVNLPKPKKYYADKGLITCSETNGVNVQLDGLMLRDTLTNKTMKIDQEILYNVDISDWPG